AQSPHAGEALRERAPYIRRHLKARALKRATPFVVDEREVGPNAAEEGRALLGRCRRRVRERRDEQGEEYELRRVSHSKILHEAAVYQRRLGDIVGPVNGYPCRCGPVTTVKPPNGSRLSCG